MGLTVHKLLLSTCGVKNSGAVLFHCVFPRHLILYVIEKRGSALLLGKQKELGIAFVSYCAAATGKAGRLVMSHVPIATLRSGRPIAPSLEAHALSVDVNIIYMGLVTAIKADYDAVKGARADHFLFLCGIS